MGRGEYGSRGGAPAPATVMPEWLGRLVEESFFVSCGAHESRKKNEKNILCLNCCSSICPHCAPAHSRHPLLQVRRYVYNDVVRLEDLEKLIDCSHVQPYTINSAKVVFLKPRPRPQPQPQPQPQPLKGSAGSICSNCGRILQEPFHFCSLSCKVEHVLSRGEDLSNVVLFHGSSDLASFSNLVNLRMDGLEDPMQCAGGGGGGGRPRKEKSSGGEFVVVPSSSSRRRKGAPRRSPLS